jgi:hypothetical protein
MNLRVSGRSPFARAIAAGALALTLPGCRHQEPAAAPVATPSVTLSRDRAALGSPVDITYKFVVAPNARFDEDYVVMLHVVDADDQLIWTDDHQPPTPTRQWIPGQTIEYTRTVFVPVFPYVGDATLQVGLYSKTTQKRLPLAGTDAGQRGYKAGRLQLLPQSETLNIVFKDGWWPVETAERNASVQWQWTKKHATFAFKNPKRDSILYLHFDNPGGLFTEVQHVLISSAGGTLQEFDVTPGRDVIKKIPIAAAQLGSADSAEIEIAVDKTFVPANLPGGSKDPRELGIRVFHAFVEPAK